MSLYKQAQLDQQFLRQLAHRQNIQLERGELGLGSAVKPWLTLLDDCSPAEESMAFLCEEFDTVDAESMHCDYWMYHDYEEYQATQYAIDLNSMLASLP